MSHFTPYEKIPTNFKKLTLPLSEIKRLEKVQWVVTEKIHGANFSFIYDKNTLQYAKRKEPLKWSDDFFAFQLLVQKIEDKILALFEALRTHYSFDQCIIYGELFGGSYPHPNIAPLPHLQAIQTGIYYSPNIEFCAFDIAIENDHPNFQRQYIDYQIALDYFQQFDLLHAKALFKGKLNEALNYPTQFDSTIPSLLNLPPLPNNLVEGIIVKPLKNIIVQSSKGSFRPIIKIKNAQFQEEKKFHEAQKWSFKASTFSKSEELGFILTELKNYVTHNRLQNVISKIGHLDLQNKQRLQQTQQDFLEDVLTDFNLNNDGFLNEIPSTSLHWLQKRLLVEIQEIIQESAYKNQ